jgi:hypothetical protein
MQLRHRAQVPAGGMPLIARAAMYLAAAAGVFLAFGWPLAFGPDPSSGAFHVAAVTTLVALLAAIVAALVAKP